MNFSKKNHEYRKKNKRTMSKKFILFGFAIALLAACQQPQARYTQNSPEIDTYKKAIENYNNKAYDTTIYADTSKTFFNNDQGMSATEVVAYHKANDANYSKRGFVGEDQEYEMVVDDKGRTWVNFWGTWKATLKATDKEYTIPVHMSTQFVDGKIAKEYGYWDATEVALAIQEIETMDNLPPEDNRATVNNMYRSFSKGDIPAVLASLSPNVTWNEAEGNAYADGNPYVGPDKVLKGIFERIGNDYEYFTLEKIKLHEMANDEVLATLRYNAKLKKNGAKIDAQAAHLWKLSNGKVIGFQQYVDTKQLDDALNQ